MTGNLIQRRGLMLVLSSPSGAGKTTLLHILGTLDRPENKPDVSLIVDGINTNELSEKEMLLSAGLE